jgi:glycine oxidase
MPNQVSEYDVIVKGAGIAGIGVAAGLALRKKRVLVVSTHALKGAGSLAAAGILHPFFCQTSNSPMIPTLTDAFDFFPSWLKRWAPKEVGRSVHYIGMNYVACGQKEEQILESQYAWQMKKGIRIQKISQKKLLQENPLLSKSVSMGLNYLDVGYLEPQLFFKAVQAQLKDAGVSFYESSECVKVIEKEGRFFFKTKEQKTIKAACYVDATGSWMAKNSFLSSVIEPVRGELFVIPNKKIKLQTIFHTTNEYYVLPWGKTETLLGSTTDRVGFRPNVTTQGKHDVFRGIEKILPLIAEEKVVKSWAGLRPVTKDRLPIVGKMRKDSAAFFVGGYYKNGMLLGPYLGDRLAEWIVSGEQDPSIKFLDTSRFKIHKKRNGS